MNRTVTTKVIASMRFLANIVVALTFIGPIEICHYLLFREWYVYGPRELAGEIKKPLRELEQ